MIQSITVTNHLDESLTLELGDPEKSGFLVQDITGLGPGKADVNFTKISTGDGSVYNSARVDSRDIVLTLKLLADPTVAATRQKSYKYFPIKKPVKLSIKSSDRICETYGYVEQNEPLIFSQNSTAQISIMCPDPYFYSPGTSTVVFSGLQDMFQFPFSNESLSENLIDFGKIQGKTEHNIMYTGDADTGVLMSISAIGPATMIDIYNVDTREKMSIDTTKFAQIMGTGILEGDEILISTVLTNKYATLIREGLRYNILNCLSRDSDWPRLAKGNNVYAYVAATGITNLKFKMEHRMVYEGV